MKREYLRRYAAAVAALALTVLLVACTLEKRHEMLVFFFDGVPPLTPPPVEAGPEPGPGPEPISNGKTIEVADQATSATMGVLPGLKGAERFSRRRINDDGEGFYHHEMPTKQCLICHDESKGLEASVEVNQSFCDKCHQEQRIKEGWNHGVINLGQCLPCHQAGHEAPYPHMLTKPVAELCLFCHQEETGMDWTPFHEIKTLRIDRNDCTACHDPHRAF